VARRWAYEAIAVLGVLAGVASVVLIVATLLG